MIASGRSSPMSTRSISPESDIPSGQPYPLSPFPQPLSPQVVLTGLPVDQETSSTFSQAAPVASGSDETPLPSYMQSEVMRDMFNALSHQLVSLVKESLPSASGAAKVDTVSTTPLPEPGLNVEPAAVTMAVTPQVPSTSRAAAGGSQLVVPPLPMMSNITPPPLQPVSLQHLDAPLLFGEDLFWRDVSAADQSSAVISSQNEFIIPDNWRVQVSEKFKLRLINESGAILKANVKPIPNLPNVKYFVGLRTTPTSTSGKEFRDYKTNDIHQEVASLSAGIPDFKVDVSQPKFSNDNMLNLKGDLSRSSLWTHWMSQARHFAASMANPHKNYPLPSEEHNFSALKVASCEGIPDEIFGFLGAAKVKLNPLSAPFMDPPSRFLERDMKLRHKALRLLSPLLVTKHLSGALVRVIQATGESNNRNALCSIRRLLLANSLTSLGDVRVAIMEAVRARQELRQVVCQKAPGYIRNRVLTSEIFT